MIYLSDLKKKYKIALIHNPRHFYQNSFWIEKAENGQLCLMGHSRNKKKNFRKVAILKLRQETIGEKIWRDFT